MRLRRHRKKSAPPDPYRFHLVDTKGTTGVAGAVVGAIITGPVADLTDGALGSAFDPSSTSGPSQLESSQPLKVPAKKKKTAKTPRKRSGS